MAKLPASTRNEKEVIRAAKGLVQIQEQTAGGSPSLRTTSSALPVILEDPDSNVPSTASAGQFTTEGQPPASGAKNLDESKSEAKITGRKLASSTAFAKTQFNSINLR